MRNENSLLGVFIFEGGQGTMALTKDDELAAAINAERPVLSDAFVAEAHPERHNSIDVR
jgi:hypothetical protein